MRFFHFKLIPRAGPDPNREDPNQQISASSRVADDFQVLGNPVPAGKEGPRLQIPGFGAGRGADFRRTLCLRRKLMLLHQPPSTRVHTLKNPSNETRKGDQTKRAWTEVLTKVLTDARENVCQIVARDDFARARTNFSFV